MTGWAVARSSHFEVFSQAGAGRAKAVLMQFEELRSFFDRNQIIPAKSQSGRWPVVRVVEFRSRNEYDAVKLRATADAYFTETGDRDYIVMPALGNDEFHVAAHEYAHFVMHAEGWEFPAWLDEGLAELFSTVNITGQRCEFGGPIPARVEVLRHHAWLPLSELFTVELNSPLRQTRQGAAVFYAQSWALADMLVSAPEYAPRFGDLLRVVNSGGMNSEQAFQNVYGRSSQTILADAQGWVARGGSARRSVATTFVPAAADVKVGDVPEFEVEFMMADLLFENGDLGRAEQRYQSLLKKRPRDPEILASLGTVALRKGDRLGAVEDWRKAVDGGLNDAALCYRFAVLADDLQLPSSEIERALERAIAIQRNFDDARFKLALLKSNAGDYSGAVEQLQAMKAVPANRAFGYWIALANALSETGKRGEAEDAAKQAGRVAKSPAERTQASELAYVAKTDLAVQFTRGADGTMQLTTTRVLHGTTEFNPFIEPGDRIQVVTGTLRNVQCNGGRLTGFLIESNGGVLALSVPDPTHVLMRNSPPEFTCGPQAPKSVKVEYAEAARNDAGLLRGMEFK